MNVSLYRDVAPVRITTGATSGHLRLGLRGLRELAGCLLKCGKRHPLSFSEKAQMRIAAQRPLMVELAQKVAHAGMVLHILRRQVRW